MIQRIAPGLKGMSAEGLDKDQATWIENLEMDQYGVWHPRGRFRAAESWSLGSVGMYRSVIALQKTENPNWSTQGVFLVTDYGLFRGELFSSTFNSVSTHSTWQYYRYENGCHARNTANDLVYVRTHHTDSDKCYGTIGMLSQQKEYISTVTSPAVYTMNASPYSDVYWVWQHENITFALRDGCMIAFSDPGQCDSWPVANQFRAMAKVGEPQVAFSIGQMSLVLGTHGACSITGTDVTSIRQDGFDILPCAPPVRSAAYGGGTKYNVAAVTAKMCGTTLIYDTTGNLDLVSYAGGTLKRIDGPIRKYLDQYKPIGGAVDQSKYVQFMVNAWYDPNRRSYALSLNSDTDYGYTYYYNIDREIWTHVISRAPTNATFGQWADQNSPFHNVQGLYVGGNGFSYDSWEDELGVKRVAYLEDVETAKLDTDPYEDEVG